MYCYNCGSQIYNGILKCPFCSADMQTISEILFDSSLRKIMPSCRKFDTKTEMRFQIGSYSVSVFEKDRLSIAINNFVNHIFENSWSEISEWIQKKSFDALIQTGEMKLQSLTETVILDTAAFMRTSGCEIDLFYAEEKFSFIRSVSYIWEPVYEIAAEFGDAKDVLDSARKSAATPRTSHWVGGGFGLRGAVKGVVTAGALNLGGEVLHGTKNFLKSRITDLYNRSLLQKGKDEVKESREFQLGLKEMWKRHLMGLHETLRTLMPSELGIKEFKPLYNWGEDLQYSYSKCDEEDAIQMLANNLYDVNAYINLYLSNREYGKTLCEIADYCGILDVVGNAFAQYGDSRIIEKMDKNAIGYDIPYEELEKLKNEADALEKQNLIYQCISQNALVIQVQQYARKVRLFYLLGKISSILDYIRNMRGRGRLMEAVEMIVANNDDLEMEILRRELSAYVAGEITILEKLEMRGSSCANLADEVRLYMEVTNSGLKNTETYPWIKHLADREVPFAMCMLGKLYLRSNDEKIKKAGVNCIKKAARHRAPEAMDLVGDWYRFGKFGFPKDKALAEQYLLLAAEMGVTAAKKSLSELQGGKK